MNEIIEWAPLIQVDTENITQRAHQFLTIWEIQLQEDDLESDATLDFKLFFVDASMIC